jgi:uncharacterized membrane protein
MVIPAVSLVSIALAIHIAAVVVAFGPLFAYPVLVATVRRTDPAALPAVYRAQHVVARRVITPALPITLIAGLYLAGKEHALGNGWVVVPMITIVMLMALHRLVLIGGYKRLADSAGQPDVASNDNVLARRVTSAQLVSAALVVFTIFVMAAKPFA